MVPQVKRTGIFRAATALALALIVGASGVVGQDGAAARASVGRSSASPAGWLELASIVSSVVPVGLIQALEGGQAVSTGSDNRLTFLLLGSDTRAGGVQRTDTIMVASVKNGVITAASIPRDTARIPNPFTANKSDYFKGRVNAILKKLKKGQTTEQALDDFEYVIEQLLKIEIDYHVLITFEGFQALVDQVDPIPVDITRQVKDGKFWDDPLRPKGVYFPARDNYELWAWQPDNSVSTSKLCNGLYKTKGLGQDYWCRRAMPFVRSRKGKGNNDFKRAARQQDFVYATIKRVAALVGSNSASPTLDALRNSASGQAGAGQLHVSDDLPLTAGNVLALYNAVKNASLGAHVVFAPKAYATRIPGTSAYQLKLSVVRAWADDHL